MLFAAGLQKILALKSRGIAISDKTIPTLDEATREDTRR
ncbi:hypothetical protein BFJ66_g16782 [Fusarium oxysporum f. sp. cepae]|uniref:Uncharacterized protein n=1 Tax=Fusarium oxysporum f. sp. cepae TaxID=396571 RepID=A0A3L6N3B4_FUSOX|nr:hypothetical protein FOMA001_g17518 [Fusarium oxysporum f. sp. matthiolae]RKK11080.1 hypothetical protein BFJ65_g15072 [Fusarium oxysporum f. sp. cepae]RKK21315.1 hypothetical protein BFJ67_g17339 [Fusarium oxysporum f. sp. cepae]RKK27176.1 hypothetical protein BFJ66_g16782 [Fusarium oxysporum f. sp. cepae]